MSAKRPNKAERLHMRMRLQGEAITKRNSMRNNIVADMAGLHDDLSDLNQRIKTFERKLERIRFAIKENL